MDVCEYLDKWGEITFNQRGGNYGNQVSISAVAMSNHRAETKRGASNRKYQCFTCGEQYKIRMVRCNCGSEEVFIAGSKETAQGKDSRVNVEQRVYVPGWFDEVNRARLLLSPLANEYMNQRYVLSTPPSGLSAALKLSQPSVDNLLKSIKLAVGYYLIAKGFHVDRLIELSSVVRSVQQENIALRT